MTAADATAADPDTRGDPSAPQAREETSGPTAPSGRSASDHRRLRRAWLTGSLPLLPLHLWMAVAGRADLFPRRVFTENFFALQTRSFFEGRLDVPGDRTYMEGFLIDGDTYIYFGPFPSLLRMPVMALTDAYDGRLTVVSMLAAAVVTVVASFRLHCRLRATLRGDAPVTRAEQVVTGVLAAAVLASPVLFLLSVPLVYHEAALWAAALCLAAFSAVLHWSAAPSPRRLAVAALVIALALCSRQALGLGPLVALALAGLVHLRRMDGGRPSGVATGDRARRLLPATGALALAGFLAVAPSVAINYAKFEQLYNLPVDRHAQSLYDEHRQDVLEQNPSMQGPEYMGTTAYQYFRPDAVELRSDFPYLDFPRSGPTLVDDDVLFDKLDWSSSIPSTAPVLTVLALLAAATGVRGLRRRRRERPGPSDPSRPPVPTWPLVVGAAAGGFGVLQLGYVANRYLADIFPLAVVAGLIGAHRLLVLLARPATSSRVRRVTVGGLVVLTGFSLLVNAALALSYQRERGHGRTTGLHAEYVGWRLSLPGDPYWVVERDEDEFRPRSADDGALLIRGDCDVVEIRVGDTRDDPPPYRESGRWVTVEEAPDDELCRAARG